MLESIFRQEAARARHCDAAFFDERDRYLIHLHGEGTSLNRIRVLAGMLLNVVENLQIRNLCKIDRPTVERANKCWLSKPGRLPKASVDGISSAFNSAAIGWLRFHGAFVEPFPPTHPYGAVLPEFIRFMAGPKAMTPATVSGYTSRASRFLSWTIKRHSAYADIEMSDVDDYFASLRQSGMKTSSIASVSQTLRSLFRFTESQGWTPSLISAGIFSPSSPRSDPEPKGPRWSDVRRMLFAPTSGQPADLRATAVLYLFAMYGLRSIEVSSLLLSDFDWTEQVFTIRRAKGGRMQRFPIESAVGHALNAYLTSARPKCSSHNFFVTLIPPFRPTSHSSLRCIVANRMKRLNIKSLLYSTHALRHSCATQLLHMGVSMNEISRFLGHNNYRSAVIYAKCSKASLREVAKFPLDGLL